MNEQQDCLSPAAHAGVVVTVPCSGKINLLSSGDARFSMFKSGDVRIELVILCFLVLPGDSKPKG